MDSVIVRQAGDDFYVMQTANAMQSLAGVEVVSIVFQSGDAGDPAIRRIERPQRWHVFAKYDSGKVTPDQIDAAIDAAILFTDQI